MFNSGWAIKAALKSIATTNNLQDRLSKVWRKEKAILCLDDIFYRGNLIVSSSELIFSNNDINKLEYLHGNMNISIPYNYISCFSLLLLKKTLDVFSIINSLLNDEIKLSENMSSNFLSSNESHTETLNAAFQNHSKEYELESNSLSINTNKCITLLKFKINSINEDYNSIVNQKNTSITTKARADKQEINHGEAQYFCLDVQESHTGSDMNLSNISDNIKQSKNSLIETKAEKESAVNFSENTLNNEATIDQVRKTNNMQKISEQQIVLFLIDDYDIAREIVLQIYKLKEYMTNIAPNDPLKLNINSSLIYKKLLNASSYNDTNKSINLCSYHIIKMVAKDICLTATDFLIDQDMATLISQSFPATVQLRSWNLLFDTDYHGVSLNTLYAKATTNKPCLLVVLTDMNVLFGAYCALGINESKHYYGNGECFIFTFGNRFNPQLFVYKWAGSSQLCMYTGHNQIIFGSGFTDKHESVLDNDNKNLYNDHAIKINEERDSNNYLNRNFLNSEQNNMINSSTNKNKLSHESNLVDGNSKLNSLPTIMTQEKELQKISNAVDQELLNIETAAVLNSGETTKEIIDKAQKLECLYNRAKKNDNIYNENNLNYIKHQLENEVKGKT